MKLLLRLPLLQLRSVAANVTNTVWRYFWNFYNTSTPEPGQPAAHCTDSISVHLPFSISNKICGEDEAKMFKNSVNASSF